MEEVSETGVTRIICTCALSITKSFHSLIGAVRSKLETRHQTFFEAAKGILEKTAVMADLIKAEREQPGQHQLHHMQLSVHSNSSSNLNASPSASTQCHSSYFSQMAGTGPSRSMIRPEVAFLLQQVQLQVAEWRAALVATLRLCRAHVTDWPLVPGLDAEIARFAACVHDVVQTAKEIQFIEGSGSVLEAIARRKSNNRFSSRFNLEFVSSKSSTDSMKVVDQDIVLNVPNAPTENIETLDEETLEKVIETFNNKWKHGIQVLIDHGMNEGTPERIAQFLFKYNDRLSKAQLGEMLGGANDNDALILTEFTKLLNFQGETFEQSIRKYLTKFQLSGEAQSISRVMETFANVYVSQNPNGIFPDVDTAFVLAFSVIMLNTDAHKEAIAQKDKMTKEQFIWNNRGTWVDGADPPRSLLEEIYDNIVNNEIKMQTKGDPEKTGWLKLHAGAIKEGKKWFVLKGNELTWYKNPSGVNAPDGMKGKIKLEYLNIKLDPDDAVKFIIISALPYPFEILTYEKNKLCPTMVKKIVLTTHSSNLAKSWVAECMNNMTYEKLPSKPGDSEAKRTKALRKSSPWATSKTGETGEPSGKQKKKDLKSSLKEKERSNSKTDDKDAKSGKDFGSLF